MLEPEPVASANPSDSDSEEESESGGAASDSAEADPAGGAAAADSAADEQVAAAGGAASETSSAGAPGEEEIMVEAAGGPVVAGGSSSELDSRLQASLEVFEGEMADKMIVLASASPPPSGEDDPAAAGGSSVNEEEPPADQTGEAPGLVLVSDVAQLPPAAGEAGERGGAATSGTMDEGGGLGGHSVSREGDNRRAMIANRIPSDVGDGSDDDVVARQIREAAMNETDPALREKLWDEYRNYKRGL